MFGVVQQVVTGIGMQKNHQPAPIERQPRQDDTDQFGTEGQLAAPVRVRANRALVDAAHLQVEQPRRFFGQGAGLVEGGGIEIEMGVVALDSLHKYLFEKPLTPTLSRRERGPIGGY